MDVNVSFALVSEDREIVSNKMKKYDLDELPVVTKENKLVGIITSDDIFDILEEEVTEDFEKSAGIVPTKLPYLSTSVKVMSMSRIK